MPRVFFNNSYCSSVTKTRPELLEVLLLKLQAFKEEYFYLKKCLKLSTFVPEFEGRLPASGYLPALAALGFCQTLPKAKILEVKPP